MLFSTLHSESRKIIALFSSKSLISTAFVYAACAIAFAPFLEIEPECLLSLIQTSARRLPTTSDGAHSFANWVPDCVAFSVASLTRSE